MLPCRFYDGGFLFDLWMVWRWELPLGRCWDKQSLRVACWWVQRNGRLWGQTSNRLRSGVWCCGLVDLWETRLFVVNGWVSNGVELFPKWKMSGIWSGKLDIWGGFCVWRVHVVCSNPPQTHSSPPSLPQNIKNGCTYTWYRTARLNGLKMARTVAGCHKFSKKADWGVYIDQKWRSLVYMTDIIGRYAWMVKFKKSWKYFKKSWK